jgi:hypothetical protein
MRRMRHTLASVYLNVTPARATCSIHAFRVELTDKLYIGAPITITSADSTSSTSSSDNLTACACSSLIGWGKERAHHLFRQMRHRIGGQAALDDLVVRIRRLPFFDELAGQLARDRAFVANTAIDMKYGCREFVSL